MAIQCKISVALATYNGSKYLQEQIDSILNQSVTDFELVICDDKSSDDTINILNEYKLNDSRIKVFENEANLGFKKNFEKSISLCMGEFIAFCDQDDIWTKDHLEILLNNIGNNDCICGNALMVDGKGDSLNITMRDFIPIHTIPQNNEEFFKHEIYGNIVQGTACMVRRELCQKSIPIPDAVRYHDWWMALNASINNGCKYTDRIILKYRRHESNVTNCPRFGFKEAVAFLIKKTTEQFNSYSETIDLLNEILSKNLSSWQKKEVYSAIRFYQGLLYKKDKLWIIKHYILKYNQIQLSKKRNLASFLYRLFCLIFKGVKL